MTKEVWTIITLTNKTDEFTSKEVHDVIKMFAGWEPAVTSERGPFVQYNVPSSGIHNAPVSCHGATISIHPLGTNLGIKTMFECDPPSHPRKYKRQYDIPHYLHRQFEYALITRMQISRDSIRLEKDTRYSEVALVNSEFNSNFIASGRECILTCIEKQLCPVQCLATGMITFNSSPFYQVILSIKGDTTDDLALEILQMGIPRCVRGLMKFVEN